MIVRQLSVEELPAITQYGEAFLREHGMQDFSPSRFLQFWTHLFLHANGVIFAAYEGEEFLGAISALMVPDPYRLGVIAQEGFWYVRPEYRESRAALKLFQAFESWASERANEIRVGCMHGPHHKAISNYFLSKGYQPFESHFVKRIQTCQ